MHRVLRSLSLVLLNTAAVAVCGAQELAGSIDRARDLVARGELEAAKSTLDAADSPALSASDLRQLVGAYQRLSDRANEGSSAAVALAADEAILRLQRRRYGERDSPDVAMAMFRVAASLDRVGRTPEALGIYEQELAMRLRIRERGAFLGAVYVAISRNNLARCLGRLGRHEAALVEVERALAEAREAASKPDDELVAIVLGHQGVILGQLDRAAEGLPKLQEARAILQRLSNGRDDKFVVTATLNLGRCLDRLGRWREAIDHHRAALAMASRLAGGRPAEDVATASNNLAASLQQAGLVQEALPQFDAALRMLRALLADRDHDLVATALANIGFCLSAIGRDADATERLEEALAMYRRLLPGLAHPEVAQVLQSLASCRVDQRRFDAAAQLADEALAMFRGPDGPRDHLVAAQCLSIKGIVQREAGRAAEAAELFQSSLAMMRRIRGERDDPDMATALRNIADCSYQAADFEGALGGYEASAAMLVRLHGEHDHPGVASAFGRVARCLAALGRNDEARVQARRSIELSERLRTGAASLAQDLRRSLWDSLKAGGPFELLQSLEIRAGHPGAALACAERSRSRDMLDLLEQRLDPVLPSASVDGVASDDRAAALANELAEVLAAQTSWLHDWGIARADATKGLPAAEAALDRLRSQGKQLEERRRRLQDEQARLVAAATTAAEPRSVDEIRAALHDGEMLLEFTVDQAELLVYAVSPKDPDVEVHRMPIGDDELTSMVDLVSRRSAPVDPGVRGRDPEGLAPGGSAELAASRRLFLRILPPNLWSRLQSCRRVWVCAHRALYRLPFEALVVGESGEEVSYWLDRGPAVAYVPSGSVLAWLRARARTSPPREHAIELLAVGDPRPMAAEPAAAAPAPGRPGDLERIARLPPLPGAATEVRAIAALVPEGRSVRMLVGGEATESAVRELAPEARYVHFACHGLADSAFGRDWSLLVLSRPAAIGPLDDGLLQLDDLLLQWRGRLDGAAMVVLAACRTNVGPTARDDAPQALPLGFLCAGAPAVVASLTPVDDESSKELMTAFYERLFAGGGDRLSALTEAKKKLRARGLGPSCWGPFLYVGLPD